MSASQQQQDRQARLTLQRWLAMARQLGQTAYCHPMRVGGPACAMDRSYKWQAAVIVEFEDAHGTARSAHGISRTVSGAGMSVALRSPLEAGDRVEVKSSTWGGRVQATVRSCRRTVEVYELDLEFDSQDRLSAA